MSPREDQQYQMIAAAPVATSLSLAQVGAIPISMNTPKIRVSNKIPPVNPIITCRIAEDSHDFKRGYPVRTTLTQFHPDN